MIQIIKKLTAISLFLLAMYATSYSQQKRFDLSVMGGYTFQDQVTFTDTYGYGILHDGFNWTVTGEYYANPLYAVELKYGRQDTKASVYDNTIWGETKEGNLSMNYIMLGANRYFRTGNKNLQPFFGLSMGAAILAPKVSGYSDVTRFAWEVKLGTKYFVSPKVGIRFQAQLLSPVQGASGGFYFGTGGAGTGISTYSSVYQFSLNGGLVFRLGH